MCQDLMLTCRREDAAELAEEEEKKRKRAEKFGNAATNGSDGPVSHQLRTAEEEN